MLFWQLELHKRLKDNGPPSFDLEGLQCLGSMLRIVALNGTSMELLNLSIQWFRIHPKESNKEIISGGVMFSFFLSFRLMLTVCAKS
jgi:hypothetical protein